MENCLETLQNGYEVKSILISYVEPYSPLNRFIINDCCPGACVVVQVVGAADSFLELFSVKRHIPYDNMMIQQNIYQTRYASLRFD